MQSSNDRRAIDGSKAGGQGSCRRAGWLLWLQLFANSLDAWMAEFHGLLTFETSALPESDPEKETLPDAVCPRQP